jgi:N6-L-threonylcarbamoyladenine synthase
MLILGIESSCDETAVAVVDSQGTIRSSVVLSQVDVHAAFGGVVPEIASREHLKAINPLYRLALGEAGVNLSEIDLIAVTMGPGLIGSLLVGLCMAKSLSYFSSIPIVGVDHVKAHIFSVFLEREVDFPFVALVVSGGHTVLFEVNDFVSISALGHTRDDAAGEAFDKVAKFLGLGYPGGEAIDRCAARGDPRFLDFPRAMIREKNFDYSFSGLKTAVVTTVKKRGVDFVRENIDHICASFQEAVVDVLVEKALGAAISKGIGRLVIAGGVAANSRLRTKLGERAKEEGVELFVPPVAYCTDNALMIAYLGGKMFERGIASDLSLNAYANVRY